LNFVSRSISKWDGFFYAQYEIYLTIYWKYDKSSCKLDTIKALEVVREVKTTRNEKSLDKTTKG
jgi:hypothetical protein